MAVFVDTSAFYAVLCASDPNHPAARQIWEHLLQSDEHLICTNYILLETSELLQHHFGIEAVRAFQDDIVPWLHIEWIDDDHHHSAVTALITSNRRGVSLTDCSSFDVMRRLSLFNAFTFDPLFSKQGFTCLPKYPFFQIKLLEPLLSTHISLFTFFGFPSVSHKSLYIARQSFGKKTAQ